MLNAYNAINYNTYLFYIGVFDFNKKTWTMWANDPINNSPLLQLPLTFTDLIDPVGNDIGINRIEVVDTSYPDK